MPAPSQLSITRRPGPPRGHSARLLPPSWTRPARRAAAELAGAPFDEAAQVAQLRAAVFGHYGTRCACCGAAERLAIDHVNGDGKAHRLALGLVGAAFWAWLAAQGFPEGYQAMCGRCNSSKGDGPACRLHPGGRARVARQRGLPPSWTRQARAAAAGLAGGGRRG